MVQFGIEPTSGYISLYQAVKVWFCQVTDRAVRIALFLDCALPWMIENRYPLPEKVSIICVLSQLSKLLLKTNADFFLIIDKFHSDLTSEKHDPLSVEYM